MLLQALCIISYLSVNSKWSYRPETRNAGVLFDIKLYASFLHHIRIETEVSVRKQLNCELHCAQTRNKYHDSWHDESSAVYLWVKTILTFACFGCIIPSVLVLRGNGWQTICGNHCTVNTYYIDGLAQDYSNSRALAMEFLQSCAKPLIVSKMICSEMYVDRLNVYACKYCVF